MKIRNISIAALVVLLSVGLVSFLWYLKHHWAGEGPVDEAGDVALDAPIDRDLEAIKQRGTLTILAPYNSTTYFLLRGEPMGLRIRVAAGLCPGARPQVSDGGR